MELCQARLDDPEVEPLLEGLAEEYEARYGDVSELATVDPGQFAPPAGVFLVLRHGGVTVAGGGLRKLADDLCEVKRMWTAPDHRRRGYASIVLEALEGEARARGYARLRLETGPAQPEARNLYEQRGYHRIPHYGIYELATAFEVRLDE